VNEQQQKPALPKPTVYDQLYPSRFIKAGELLGKKVTLTISSVDLERLIGDDGKEKVKALVAFKETEKQFVMCKTNGLCLKNMFGKEIQAWIGKRITLFEDTWNGEPATRVWGSPDIPQDIDVEIALPRRRPFKKTMHRMGAGSKAGAQMNGSGKAEPPSSANSIAAARSAETVDSLADARKSVWGVYAAANAPVPLEVEGAFNDRQAALEQASEDIPL
jgi:hypothetical protein